jgi:hypothetical protein
MEASSSPSDIVVDCTTMTGLYLYLSLYWKLQVLLIKVIASWNIFLNIGCIHSKGVHLHLL